MKWIAFVLAFLMAGAARAGISSMKVEGKVVSFDAKIVTIEIAGANYRFTRGKLGRAFSSLSKGQIVMIAVDPRKDLAGK